MWHFWNSSVENSVEFCVCEHSYFFHQAFICEQTPVCPDIYLHYWISHCRLLYILFASPCTRVHENVRNVLRILQRRSLRISGKIFDLYNRWNAFVCRVLLTSKLLCAYYSVPIPIAARSKIWVCDRSPAGIVVSNPAGGMYVCRCECCVLSGRGLCFGLITRPEESYRLCCVWVWSWSLENEEALAN